MDSETLAATWLGLQCRMIPGARRAVVLVQSADSQQLAATAVWPAGVVHEPELATCGAAALAAGKQVVHSVAAETGSAAGRRELIAHPLALRGGLSAVVVVEFDGGADPQRNATRRSLEWGSAWLELLLLQQDALARDRLATVIEVLARGLEQERFQAAATAVVTDLANRLSCDRVSIGFLQDANIRVRALSHNADFEGRSNLIQDIEAAMEEAVDQQCSLVFPPSADDSPLVTRAQGELARRHQSAALCSLPISVGGQIRGALTLERSADRIFDADSVELCEHLAGLVGPLLELKRRDDRWLPAKVWDSAKAQAARLFGAGHLLRKIAVVAALGIGLYLYSAEGDYRIAAKALLEPGVQRAVVAPIDGYIQTAEVRAGDLVAADSLLARLEDKDLKLEYLKWSSQRAQLAKQHRQALAAHDRAEVSILKAQIGQAEAQIALLREQLERTRLLAPFEGIVVTGDLSQKLGSPVERGEVLFEVAPLHAYRVILKVDEREIADVRVGQRGRLALSGLPSERLPLVVEKITPVSTAADGVNYFRVEAGLEQSPALLRPGMEGVAKIDVDRRPLIWLWTHKAFDWVRLRVWFWWPF